MQDTTSILSEPQNTNKVYARKGMIDEFFYWINERHRIYLKKEAGEPKPWTEDPILQKYFFTNYDRQLDKVTKWWTNFCSTHLDDGPNLITNITWYRLFNLPSIGELIGWREEWNVEEISSILLEHQKNGNNVFNNAYMITGVKGEPKVVSMCKLVKKV